MRLTGKVSHSYPARPARLALNIAIGIWFSGSPMNIRKILVIAFVFLFVNSYIAQQTPFSWASTRLSFDGFEILSVAVSPSGKYIAVIYGDKAYYTRTLKVYDANLTLVYTAQLNSFSDVALIFLNDTACIISEYVWNSQVPFSYIRLLNIESGRLLTSSRIPGTYLKDLKKAIVVGKTLYVLTRGYLLGFDASNLTKRTYIKAFINQGLQIIPVSDALVVLSIETNCHICLEMKEKTITVLDSRGERSLTLCHVVALVGLPNESIGILFDNNTISRYVLVNGNLESRGNIQSLLGGGAASEPLYKLVYSLDIKGVDVSLLIYNATGNKLKLYHLPLPYTKGDQVGVKVGDDGYFVAWSNDTIVIGSPSGFNGTIKLGKRVQDVFYGGGRVFAVSSDGITIFERKNLENIFTFTVDVASEDGSYINNYTLILNGERKNINNSSMTLLLPQGIYNVTIDAPGHVPSSFTVNLTSNTRKTILLQKLRYPLIVHASTTTGESPEIIVYRTNIPIVRGVGVIEVNLLPGNYTLVVSQGNISRMLQVSLFNRTEIHLLLNTSLISPSMSNSSSSIKPSQPNTTQYVIIYGEQTCPDCRQTKEILQNMVGNIYFKDISNQTYLSEYNLLYQFCGAGNLRVVPLTLVFRGTNLQAVVAGTLPVDQWRQILSLNVNNGTLIVTDTGERRYRRINSTKVYEVAVTGLRTPVSTTGHKENLVPLILALAAADSINPCTFMVFAALIMAIMGFAGRRKAIEASIAFIAAVFASYIILGLGLIRFAAIFAWLKYVIAAVSLVAGLYTTSTAIVSYQEGCREAKSSRENASPTLGKALNYYRRIKEIVEEKSHTFLSQAQRGSVLASFLGGVLVSFTLLPCSGGPYLVASYILSQVDTFEAAILLLLYNTVFILPLVLIATGVILGGRLLVLVDVATVHLNALRRWTGLLLGLLLLVLGIYILIYR